MSRCRCDDLTVDGCQCGWGDSDCIAVSGTGEPGDPLILTPILDPDENNMAACGDDGLLVLLPELFANPPRAKVQRSTAQEVPCCGGDTPETNIFAYIEFDVVEFDTSSFFDSGDPTKLTIPVDGLYELKFHVGMDPDPVGPNAFRADIVRNSNAARICYTVTWSSGPGIGTRMRDSTFYELDAGDFLRLRVQNNSAGAMNANSSFGLDNLMEVCWRCPKAAA